MFHESLVLSLFEDFHQHQVLHSVPLSFIKLRIRHPFNYIWIIHLQCFVRTLVMPSEYYVLYEILVFFHVIVIIFGRRESKKQEEISKVCTQNFWEKFSNPKSVFKWSKEIMKFIHLIIFAVLRLYFRSQTNFGLL